jgi:hypothetical protein
VCATILAFNQSFCFYFGWNWGFEPGFYVYEAGGLSLSHVSSLSALIILEKVSFAFCPGWPGLLSYFKLPAIVRMTDTDHHTQHFSFETGFCTLFCLGWPRGCNPSNLSLPSRQDYRHEPLVPGSTNLSFTLFLDPDVRRGWCSNWKTLGSKGKC